MPLINQEIIVFRDNLDCSGALDPSQVAGKIVMCFADDASEGNTAALIQNAGGIGMLSLQRGEIGGFVSLKPYPIPTAQISLESAKKIIAYMGETSTAGGKSTATLRFKETVGSSVPAPKVAVFSSRGPNRITPEILKPDIIAPGVNILAGWPSGGFNMQSGTSMACPHVSGLAALLRSAYPNWSPAAIKSALMTTAYEVDNSDPNRALNPGLVYDIAPSGYEAFLCSIGYDDAKISVFVTGRTVDCGAIGLSSPGDLNYPSFSVVLKSGTDTVKYKRVVTNVGSSAAAVYKLKARSRTPLVRISVTPTVLVFDSSKTSLSYEVTFKSLITGPVDTTKEEFGSIEWSDGAHVVKSPIAFRWATSTTSSISSI
ncbi:subtilisin-like protease SBT1.4 [Papaver somniferum]|uniref:subtilisin-like protease SBT1.4 n=1 Tax=Papaver somniferum TaxID=3469 RepID=UPI000E6F8084|nr:subtilisin-like protease SBT1.4 [Papaver somniferum]